MELLFGTLVIALPVLLVGYLLLWRNYRPVFWMMSGALALGLGYLGFVGASEELGKPIAEAIHGYSAAPSATKTSTESEMPAAATMKESAAGGEAAVPAKSASEETPMPAATTEPAKGSMSSSDGRYVTQ